MAVITAAMVGQLRAKTDAPMMECKKALTEANGDIQKRKISCGSNWATRLRKRPVVSPLKGSSPFMWMGMRHLLSK